MMSSKARENTMIERENRSNRTENRVSSET